ncbi:MAG: transporter substrate-binding domain-containing protein [Colwellia sp.]|nr:transporter substrate-binding domain-containing protein [Colwellia sp.]
MKLTSLILISTLYSASLSAENLMVVTENWPPFNYQNKQQAIVGTVTKNVKEVLALTSLTYQINLYPWARSFQMAKSKKNVLIYSILKTVDREPLFHWYCPIYPQVKTFVFQLKNSNIQASSIEQIKSYRVGITRDGINHQFLLNSGFVEGKNLYLANNEKNNINKLFSGNIDFIIQAKESLAFRLNVMGKESTMVQAVFKLNDGQSENHCMALSINSSEAIKMQLDSAFNQWKTNQQLVIN